MMYMLGIYLIVAVPVFALAGIVLLAMIAITKVKNYVRAQWATRIPCPYPLQKDSPILPS